MPRLGNMGLASKASSAQTVPGVGPVITAPTDAEVDQIQPAGGAIAPFLKPLEFLHAKISAGMANVRVAEDIYPQQSPDPPRDGDVPSRHSVQQIAITSPADPGIFGGWSSEDNWLGKVEPYGPHTQTPRGQMTPGGVTPNIDRPAAVAYGSLFELAPQSYGYE